MRITRLVEVTIVTCDICGVELSYGPGFSHAGDYHSSCYRMAVRNCTALSEFPAAITAACSKRIDLLPTNAAGVE